MPAPLAPARHPFYRCMDVDDYADWRRFNSDTGCPAASPCVDCEPDFAALMGDEGRCVRTPVQKVPRSHLASGQVAANLGSIVSRTVAISPRPVALTPSSGRPVR